MKTGKMATLQLCDVGRVLSARELVGVALSLLAFTLMVARGVGQERPEQKFQRYDKNRDGQLTPEELPFPRLFQRLDVNADGVVTRQEAAALLQRPATPEETRPAVTDPNSAVEPPSVRQGPKIMRPGEHGVGIRVPDLEFKNLQGKSHSLTEVCRQRPTVFAFTSTSCPVSQKYLPTLVELRKSHSQFFNWVFVNPVPSDDHVAQQAAASQLGADVLYVPDTTGELSRSLQATSTADVVVLDQTGTILYHGPVDDQYGLGYAQDAPRQRYLVDALLAIRDGRSVALAALEAPGCSLPRRKVADTNSSAVGEAPTYYERISRIVQRHCVECHRTSGVAPFPLETHEQVTSHAEMIAQVLQRGTMPPWFAAPASSPLGATPREPGNLESTAPLAASTTQVTPAQVTSSAVTSGTVEHLVWANERRLSSSELRDIQQWMKAGMPEGDRAHAPLPLPEHDGWLIGQPDVVFAFNQAVDVKATGTMPYHNVIVETHLQEDRWVRSIEVRPGDRRVVHHVLVFVVGSEQDDGSDVDDESRGFWGIYVPGNSTLQYPDGYAKRIPKGAKLRFQMHYTPNGTATTDRTSIGMIFATEPPRHQIRVAGIVNSKIRIPAGAPRHQEQATLRLPRDVEILALLPHLHLRGTACRFESISRSGQTQNLLEIPRYDFNWQLLYRYAQPVALRRGEQLRFTGWYDNSAQNPANPDPGQTVTWGPQTFDEMLLGYVEYVIPEERIERELNAQDRESTRASIPTPAALTAIFRRLDRDRDGQLTAAEIPVNLRPSVLKLDQDGSGTISLEEALRYRPE